MILMKDIVREGTESLREPSVEVKLPISDEDKNTLIELFRYVITSQNKEQAEELGLRPGVGLAGPQIGVNKKMFAVFTNDEEGKTWVLPVINPVITKRSKALVYLNGGEGCLSVDRETCGVTPRNIYIEATALVYDFEKDKFEQKKLKLKDYVAIVFQHEYDHLFGTLYVDKLMSEEDAKAQGILPLWEETEK